MCKERDSLKRRREAIQHLAEACLECAGGIAAALKSVFDETIAEPIPDDLKQLVDRLQ